MSIFHNTSQALIAKGTGNRFGIVGGYGATGRDVVSEIRKSCDGEILIGGRDLARAGALAEEFDAFESLD